MKLIVLITLLFSVVKCDTIYIFYPFISNTDSLQSLMKEELPNSKVIIFGKYSKLKTQIKTEVPDALISTQIVVDEFFSTNDTTLKGKVDNAFTESYSIISLFPIDTLKFETAIFGAVNQGDRSANKKQIQYLLDLEIKKLKRVTKTDDLLSLLRFNIIDFAIIKDTQLKSFTSKTKQQIYTKQINSVQLPIITFAENGKLLFTKKIYSFPKNINHQLGIHSWE